MSKEKMIEQLGNDLIRQLGRELVDKFVEDEKGNLIAIETYSLNEVAESLINTGYGHIPTAIKEFAKYLIDYVDEVKENGYDGIGQLDIADKCASFLEEYK